MSELTPEQRSRVDQIDVTFVRYPTAKALLLAHLNCDPECPVEDVGDVVMGFTTGEGNPDEEMPGEEFLDAIVENRFWGYAESGSRRVHYWADPSTPDDVLAMLLGHEVGHILGEPKGRPEDDEDMADTYGHAACAALREIREFRSVQPCPKTDASEGSRDAANTGAVG